MEKNFRKEIYEIEKGDLVKTITDARYEFLRQEGDGIPHMKVTLTDAEGNKVTEGYLSPFRGYRFQVSGNSRGSGDYGSTIVMDLRDLIMRSAKPYQASDLLEMMAQQAIYEFIKVTLNMGDGKIVAAGIDHFSIPNSATMGKFIEESMKWLLKTDNLDKYGVVNNHLWDEEDVAYCDE